MRSKRFEIMTAVALTNGARLYRTGDGQFLALARGQRFEFKDLDGVARWLGCEPGESANKWLRRVKV